MSNPRSHELADRFMGLNKEIATFVQSCSDALWRSPCPEDGRSIGVVTHHIAASHALIGQLIGIVATGQPLPPITPALLDQANAEHATRHANCRPDEVVALLRTNGQTVADAIRRLGEEDLTRRATGEIFGARMSTEEVIEHVLIGHAAGHFQRLQVICPG